MKNKTKKLIGKLLFFGTLGLIFTGLVISGGWEMLLALAISTVIAIVLSYGACLMENN